MILRDNRFASLSVIFCISIFIAIFQAPKECYSFEIAIDVAPNTLNIQSQGQVVTVHTSIVYGDVDHENVYLNQIPINSWKSDSRGYFVAKFLMGEVKALADSGDLVVPGENELSLIGYTTEGTEFTGYQIISVINVKPAGNGEK
jgi:hypothetical protein